MLERWNSFAEETANELRGEKPHDLSEAFNGRGADCDDA